MRVDAADAVEEHGLHALLETDGIPPEDRLVRRVANVGFADDGIALTTENLCPEPTLAADGAWWHPVGIAEPTMQVASTRSPSSPCSPSSARHSTTPGRDRDATLQRFRCS